MWGNGQAFDYNAGHGHAPVQVEYQGWLLQKADLHNGETPKWSRATQTPLRADNETLESMGRKYRDKTQRGPLEHFTDCGPKQQRVINRIIETAQASETHGDAEWVLHCVKRTQRRKKGWSSQSLETVKILVILKRQGRNGTRPRQRLSRQGLRGTMNDGIIDINEPLPANFDAINFNPNGAGHPQFHDHYRNDGFQGQPQPRHQHQEPILSPPVAVGPNQWQPEPVFNGWPEHGTDNDRRGRQNHAVQEEPPAVFVPEYSRPPPQDNHPFQPEAHIPVPPITEYPVHADRDNRYSARAWTPEQPRSLSRSRSQARRREREEEEHRRLERERERLERRMDNLEDRNERINDRLNFTEKVHETQRGLEDVMHKVERWNLRDGSSERGRRDGTNVWSSHESRFSSTPPTSPSLSAARDLPHGSLRHRTRVYRPRTGGYRSSKRYARDEWNTEPFSHSSHRRTSYDDTRRRHHEDTASSVYFPPTIDLEPPRRPGFRSTRPILHYANTADDYPGARDEEDYYDFLEFEHADGRDDRGRRRRSRRDSMFDDTGRRESRKRTPWL